jgi:Cys-tRNA(Pro) deacylase
MADKTPVTMAIRMLRQHEVAYVPHSYTWQPKGGTQASALALGVAEHCVIKTLIFENDQGSPLCILMHGDKEVSGKNLARLVGCKSVAPCSPTIADKHSGYLVGGTSPFGLKKNMPIYMQTSIANLPIIYINGGARGFLVEIAPTELLRVLEPKLVDIAVP